MASDSLASLEEEDDVGRFALGGLKAERERARDGKDEEAQAEGQENEDWAVLAKEARKLIVLPVRTLFLSLLSTACSGKADRVCLFLQGFRTSVPHVGLPAIRVQLLFLLWIRL